MWFKVDVIAPKDLEPAFKLAAAVDSRIAQRNGYYGIKYDLYHDDLTIREWHGNVVLAHPECYDPTSLQLQSNDFVPKVDLTSTLQQIFAV